MSDSPLGDQAAVEQDARAIHVDHAKGMLVGDHGTQSNSSTHVDQVGRDSYVAGRDQYVIHPEGARQCKCGIYAVGACRECGLPMCSRHGASLNDVFLCSTHWQGQQQTDEVAQEGTASERRTASPGGDGSRSVQINLLHPSAPDQDWNQGTAPVSNPDPDASIGGRRLHVARIAALIAIGAAGVAGLVVLLLQIPSSDQTGTLAAYPFSPQYAANGLVIQRNWTISQHGTATFTESITAANTTGLPITERFTEPVPAVMTAELLSAHFSLRRPDIMDLGRVIGWTLKIPAYGRMVLSYAVPVADPERNPGAQKAWAGAFLAQEANMVNAAATLKAIVIQQGNPSLTPSSTRQLTLIGILFNGETAPAAAFLSASWKSADTKVAVVSADGTIIAVGPGSTTITAQVEVVTATAKVTVTDARSLPGGGRGGNP